MKLVYIAGPFTPTAMQKAEVSAYAAKGRAGLSYCDLTGAVDLALHVAQRVQQCIDANIAAATAVALRVAESGHMPVCPHSNTGDPRFLALQTPEFWYAGTLELMRRCDAIALTDDWSESNGACREVIEAIRLGKLEWHNDELHTSPLYEWTAIAALRSRGQEP